MTQPRQWSAIWAEKHNRELLKKTVKWGKDTSEVVDLPMPVGHDSVLLAIDNQTDKSLTGTIAQLLRFDDANGSAVITCEPEGEGEPESETITITSLVKGVGKDSPERIRFALDAGGEDAIISPTVEVLPYGTAGRTEVLITLVVDGEGQPDPSANTASAIVAAIEGGEGLMDILSAQYSGEGTGVVSANDDDTIDFTGGQEAIWAPLYDSDGVELELVVNDEECIVFGPFNYFPRFLGGRLTLTAGEAPTEDGVVVVQMQGI